MKVSDAPRAGWYPDPEGRTRCAGGTAATGSTGTASVRSAPRPRASWRQAQASQVGGDQAFDLAQLGNAMHLPPQTAAVVEQVRLAARPRPSVAQDFEARTRKITGEIPPLISQYTNRFMRWFRVLLTLSFIVLMAWFIYQFFVQKSFFDWLGDRIDNMTDGGVFWRKKGLPSTRAGAAPQGAALYGVDESQYSNEEEMYDRIHEMRTRIITSPSFNGDRVLGAILFENTMDREIEGSAPPSTSGRSSSVVPFLKVDKGLADEPTASR